MIEYCTGGTRNFLRSFSQCYLPGICPQIYLNREWELRKHIELIGESFEVCPNFPKKKKEAIFFCVFVLREYGKRLLNNCLMSEKAVHGFSRHQMQARCIFLWHDNPTVIFLISLGWQTQLTFLALFTKKGGKLLRSVLHAPRWKGHKLKCIICTASGVLYCQKAKMTNTFSI